MAVSLYYLKVLPVLNLATAVYIYAVALNLEGTGTYTTCSTLKYLDEFLQVQPYAVGNY